MCRSRRELSNAYFLVESRFDSPVKFAASAAGAEGVLVGRGGSRGPEEAREEAEQAEVGEAAGAAGDPGHARRDAGGQGRIADVSGYLRGGLLRSENKKK